MYNNSIPLYFFPTSTAFLDDDPHFLENIKFQLKNPECIKIFNSYKKFEEYYQKHSSKIDAQCVELEDGYDDDSISVNVRLEKIKDVSKIKDKSNLLTGVVIDYNMPLLNGLEVIKLLPSSIYKILLTGVADESIAIEAFNNRLINQFIKKQNNNIINQLNDQIKIVHEHYFLNESNKITSLIGEEFVRYSLINDEVYKQLWNSLVKKHDFIEGYIIDLSGSYLFYDRFGNNYCFVVQTEEQAEANIDIIPIEEFSDKVVNDIKQKRILYVPDSENFMLKSNILDSIKITNGSKIFYYGLGKNQYEPQN